MINDFFNVETSRSLNKPLSHRPSFFFSTFTFWSSFLFCSDLFFKSFFFRFYKVMKKHFVPWTEFLYFTFTFLPSCVHGKNSFLIFLSSPSLWILVKLSLLLICFTCASILVYLTPILKAKFNLPRLCQERKKINSHWKFGS